MSLWYLWKSIQRHKMRSLTIALGIFISITMITGMSLASDQLRSYQILNEINNVRTDIVISTVENKHYLDLFDRIDNDVTDLNNLIQKNDDFLYAFPTMPHFWRLAKILQENETVNWNATKTLDNYNLSKIARQSQIYAFPHNIFDDSRTESRYANLFESNQTIDFSQAGIYLDYATALANNLSVGDEFSMSFFRKSIYVDQVTSDLIDASYSMNISDIQIVGIYQFTNSPVFLEEFGGNQADVSLIKIIGGMDYIINHFFLPMYNQSAERFDTTIEEFKLRYLTLQYHILLDHERISEINPNKIASKLKEIESLVKNSFPDPTFECQVQLNEIVSNIEQLSYLFQGIYIVVSVPVILLGWYLCKTTWILSYQSRRREISLLKVRGGSRKQLKTMFRIEAALIGCLGGLFGIIGGHISAHFILQSMYPEIAKSFLQIFSRNSFFKVDFLSISRGGFSFLLGMGMSVTAVNKPLAQFIRCKPVDGLKQFDHRHANKLMKTRTEVILLILGIIPIAMTLISQGFIPTDERIFASVVFLILSALSTPLLPFAPFFLIYSTIRLICQNSHIFSGIIKFLSRVHPKAISLFANKSILRNQARSFRLIFLISISLSFLVMASTIEDIETEHQHQMRTLQTGDGLITSVFFQRSLTQGLDPFMNYVDKHLVDIGAVNYTCALRYAESGLDLELEDIECELAAIECLKFTQYIELKDSWIEDEKIVPLLEDLSEIPNAIIIPTDLANKGIEVGDTISMSYLSTTFDMATVDLHVIGIYTIMPIVYAEFWSNPVITNIHTLNSTEALVESMALTFYDDLEANKSLTLSGINTMIQNYPDSETYTYRPHNVDYENYSDTLLTSLLQYLNLESYYLIAIVCFGTGIIMYISIREKSRDLSLLRARAVPKGVLFKIQFSEGFILIFISILFILLGILGAFAMILQLNNVSILLENFFPRTISIPWGKIALQVSASIFMIFCSIGFAVFFESRKSDIGKITTILRSSS